MRNPLDKMKIRTHQDHVLNPQSNVWGMVRTQEYEHTGKIVPKAHQGWDLAATPHTSVYAITFGLAEKMPWRPKTWGNWVRLKFLHRGRDCYAFYCHLSDFGFLGVVAEGTRLGATGRSGNARNIPKAEAHLHFGISRNPEPNVTGYADHVVDYIDPAELLGPPPF